MTKKDKKNEKDKKNLDVEMTDLDQEKMINDNDSNDNHHVRKVDVRSKWT